MTIQDLILLLSEFPLDSEVLIRSIEPEWSEGEEYIREKPLTRVISSWGGSGPKIHGVVILLTEDL